MGDEDQTLIDSEESTEEESSKSKGLSALLTGLLKWVAVAIGVIVVAGTTSFVIVNGVSPRAGSNGNELARISPLVQAKRAPLENYDEIEAIRGVTSDEEQAIFTLQVSLLYEMGNTTVNTELISRKREIQNLVFLHVSQKSAEDLRPEYYTTLQEELKQLINRVLSQGRIEQVVFREFVVAQ